MLAGLGVLTKGLSLQNLPREQQQQANELKALIFELLNDNDENLQKLLYDTNSEEIVEEINTRRQQQHNGLLLSVTEQNQNQGKENREKTEVVNIPIYIKFLLN